MTATLLLSISLALARADEAESLQFIRESLMKRDYQAALEKSKKALAEFPKSARLWHLQGLAHDRLRKFPEALNDFNKALQLDPALDDALDQRGSVYFKMGRMKESGEDFDKFIKLKPSEFPAHWRRGIVLYYLGRFKEGHQQFEAYQKVDGNDVENGVWHYLCLARDENRDKARAAMLPIQMDRRIPMMEVYALFQGKSSVEKVMELAEKAPEAQKKMALFYAHLYLGIYHESQDKPEKALAHMEKAAELGPLDHYMGDVARVHRDRLRKKSP